jgi:hypothetical protein
MKGVHGSSTSVAYRIQGNYDSGRREIMCNILIEFGIPVKLVRLMKI